MQLYRSPPELWKVKSDVYKNFNLKNTGFGHLFFYEIYQETEVSPTYRIVRAWRQLLFSCSTISYNTLLRKFV